ncbi:MAG TPA: signal peptidase I [Polyangiaceae bacterium]|nr:signal peptidase I [Polyangiaceae bacterium]
MKTEEPRSAKARGSVDDAGVANGAGAPIAAEAVELEVPSDGHSVALPPGATITRPVRSRLLRLVFWAVWFCLVPILGAFFVLWLLLPSGGAEPTGVLGAVQSFVGSQSVPVGIVIFTVLEVGVWVARQRLPLARHAYPPLRTDVAPEMRPSLDRAQALLDEAEMILSRYESGVAQKLTAKERDRVRSEMHALRVEMDRVPFDEAAFNDALVRADSEVDGRLGAWRKSELREYVEAIVMAVVVALGLRTFVLEAFKIPSGSMIPTLMVGDHIFVNKFSYGPAIPFTSARVWTNMPPKRGDVIVFAYPEQPEQDFIKRVIVIPGDKLEARGGHPIINGWPVPSCLVGAWSYNDYESPITRHEGDLYIEYLGDESYLTFYDRASGVYAEYQGPFYAKKGEVWVMGDARNNSHDSRMWFGGKGGGVPYDNIRGRALFVWLSLSGNGVDLSREGAQVMGRPHLPPTAKDLQPQFDQCLRDRPKVTAPPNPQ